jgi:hypothetical protein
VNGRLVVDGVARTACPEVVVFGICREVVGTFVLDDAVVAAEPCGMAVFVAGVVLMPLVFVSSVTLMPLASEFEVVPLPEPVKVPQSLSLFRQLLTRLRSLAWSQVFQKSAWIV